jgi:hypothetical protein
MITLYNHGWCSSRRSRCGFELVISNCFIFCSYRNVTYHGQNPTFTAEEQINATRLFKQLYSQIQTTLALRDRKELDVKDAMEKTLALDKA